MQSYEEKILLDEVADGNEKSFARLFEQWHPLLAAYIYRITESRELTQEIVQDVFLKIWMTRETLKEIESFKSYLLVISRNQARNALRSVMREKKRNSNWQQQQTIIINEQGEKQNELFYSIVDEAIERLPPQQQKVYLLHRYKKLTYKQIAAELGISAETVKEYKSLATASIAKYVRSVLPKALFIIFFMKI